MPAFTLNTAVIIFHLKSVSLRMLSTLQGYTSLMLITKHTYTLFETFSNQPLS